MKTLTLIKDNTIKNLIFEFANKNYNLIYYQYHQENNIYTNNLNNFNKKISFILGVNSNIYFEAYNYESTAIMAHLICREKVLRKYIVYKDNIKEFLLEEKY